MAFNSMGKGARRLVITSGVAFVAAATLAACGSSGGGSSSASTPAPAPTTSGAPAPTTSSAPVEKSKVYFTNNFSDNDWRQQMQKTVELAAALPQYADIMTLEVSNSGVAPEDQAAMIESIIAKGDADAIIMEAASPEAVNQAIQNACDAGIKVVTFDSLATAPCAWKVAVDWKYNGQVAAAFVAEALGGKGQVAVDYGLKGLAIGLDFTKGVKEELAKYPGIEIVGEYEGGFNPAQEKSGTAAILASYPDLAASMTMYVGAPAAEAFIAAGKTSYVISGTANNAGAMQCAGDANQKCVYWTDSPGISVLALNVALDAISGKEATPRTLVMDAPNGYFYVKGNTSIAAYPNANVSEWTDGVNFYSDQPGSLSLPVLPVGIDLPITAADVVG